MKPLHALLISLMLICVALVSYDGGKRQARCEMLQVASTNAPAFLIASNTVIEWSTGNQLRDSDGEVVLELAEWAYTETVWTNKDGYFRSVIESDGGTVIRTNRPAAPARLRVVEKSRNFDDLFQLHQQIDASRQATIESLRQQRKIAFEAGFYRGGLMMVNHLKTNSVAWPSGLSQKIINASTNELKAAWDEFNREP